MLKHFLLGTLFAFSISAQGFDFRTSPSFSTGAGANFGMGFGASLNFPINYHVEPMFGLGWVPIFVFGFGSGIGATIGSHFYFSKEVYKIRSHRIHWRPRFSVYLGSINIDERPRFGDSKRINRHFYSFGPGIISYGESSNYEVDLLAVKLTNEEGYEIIPSFGYRYYFEVD